MDLPWLPAGAHEPDGKAMLQEEQVDRADSEHHERIDQALREIVSQRHPANRSEGPEQPLSPILLERDDDPRAIARGEDQRDRGANDFGKCLYALVVAVDPEPDGQRHGHAHRDRGPGDPSQ